MNVKSQKSNTIENYKHPYYKTKINKYQLNDTKLPLDEFNNEEIKKNIIKSYFELYKNNTIEDCMKFINHKIKGKIKLEEKIKNEIIDIFNFVKMN